MNDTIIPVEMLSAKLLVRLEIAKALIVSAGRPLPSMGIIASDAKDLANRLMDGL